ncbi:hypothetical protein BGZ61DRAFT_133467 [Ilyonectria robusta]|uniref:uncharacterized protein n=1 Tax=Ilyonectria robusta TaxID=1079257 RepID=UPI001E8EDAB6|nr:uncharacterized protein BGZ61DRAFT_133467 [Ilyonectria robusta]KAH8734995.1 hypothetical protein BGZ61DRAFT_133467 [Ilyonectria robusta]
MRHNRAKVPSPGRRPRCLMATAVKIRRPSSNFRKNYADVSLLSRREWPASSYQTEVRLPLSPPPSFKMYRVPIPPICGYPFPSRDIFFFSCILGLPWFPSRGRPSSSPVLYSVRFLRGDRRLFFARALLSKHPPRQEGKPYRASNMQTIAEGKRGYDPCSVFFLGAERLAEKF